MRQHLLARPLWRLGLRPAAGRKPDLTPVAGEPLGHLTPARGTGLPNWHDRRSDAAGVSMPRSKFSRPSDPDVIARRRGRLAEVERKRAADPSNWGMADGLVALDTSETLTLERGRIRRQNVFDALRAAGGLAAWQHEAASRLIRDWAEMLGVAGAPIGPPPKPPKDNDGRGGPELVTLRMMTGRDRVVAALAGVGPSDRILLARLVQPIVMVGVGTDWRGQVKALTGEDDKNRQAEVVKRACENLRLVYGLGPMPEQLHPFGATLPQAG